MNYIPNQLKQMETILSNIIKIETKSVYGNDLMYVVSEHAEAIQSLTGKKTIDASDIKQLKVLGFTFEAAVPDLAVN